MVTVSCVLATEKEEEAFSKVTKNPIIVPSLLDLALEATLRQVRQKGEAFFKDSESIYGISFSPELQDLIRNRILKSPAEIPLLLDSDIIYESEGISDEIWLYIFSFLKPEERFPLDQVCQHFYSIESDEKFWNVSFVQAFGRNVQEFLTPIESEVRSKGIYRFFKQRQDKFQALKHLSGLGQNEGEHAFSGLDLKQLKSISYRRIDSFETLEVPQYRGLKAVWHHGENTPLVDSCFLDKSNMLTVLPAMFLSLENIEKMSLFCSPSNSSLPRGLNFLQNLRELEFRCSSFDSFPPEIACLTKLTTLHFNFYLEPTSSFPQGISHFNNLVSGLKSLKIGGMPILSEEIWDLTALTDLDLTGNRLESLPFQMSKLTNLMSLKLDFNSFTSMPPIIRSLTGLRYLSYYETPLAFTPQPEWFSELKDLNSYPRGAPYSEGSEGEESDFENSEEDFDEEDLENSFES
jgi:Leucine-rich repeat (LRR) protein